MNGPQSTHRPPRRLERLLRLLIAAFTILVMAAPSLGQGRDPHRIRTVVIDAGHGGKDPGALGTGRYKTSEKHVALNVSLMLGRLINEAYPDVKVVYTRSDDRFVELMERSIIANRAKADLFISIHCNSNEKSDPYGVETYVMGLHKTEANMKVAMKENAAILLEEGHELKYGGYDPKRPESQIELSLRQNVHLDQSLQFSALAQKHFKERAGRMDRGVKQAGFLVISYTTMPAVLVELGFLSNPAEEDFLQSEQGQEKLAMALMQAFREYKGAMEGLSAATYTPPAQEPVGEAVAPPVADKGVRFKVQIATSTKHIEPKARNFNGFEGVEEHKGQGLYKYTVGDEPTLERARELQRLCREKGYDGAFIVAFRDGQRIDLQEAVNLAQGR